MVAYYVYHTLLQSLESISSTGTVIVPKLMVVRMSRLSSSFHRLVPEEDEQLGCHKTSINFLGNRDMVLPLSRLI